MDTLLHAAIVVDLISPVDIVFDTETTGTSKNDVIVELGFVVLCRNTKYESHSHLVLESLVQPMSPRAYDVHGITNEEISTSGRPIVDVLDSFFEFVKLSRKTGGRVIAHNASFDRRMLKQTLERFNLFYDIGDIFCTMQSSKNHVGALNVKGSLKNPTKEELYKFQFNEDVPTTHRAAEDANLTAKSYVFGKLNAWW